MKGVGEKQDQRGKAGSEGKSRIRGEKQDQRGKVGSERKSRIRGEK